MNTSPPRKIDFSGLEVERGFERYARTIRQGERG
jgi:hypothetical protein